MATKTPKSVYTIAGTTLGFVILYIILTSFVFVEQFRKYIFRAHIGPIYFYFLVLAVVLLIFGVLLTYRNFVNEHGSLLFMELSIFLAGFSYLFGFFNFEPFAVDNSFKQTRLFQLQVLTQTISVFFLYLHYELNTRTQPRTGFVSVIILLFTPQSLFNLFYFFGNTYTDNHVLQNFEILTLIMLQIGAILVFGWLVYNALTIYPSLIKRGQRTKVLSSIQLAGLFLLFYSVILQGVEAEVPNFDVWHTPLNVIALMCVGMTYYFDPTVLLFAPISVKLLGVVDNIGRTHYYKPVDPAFTEDSKISTTSELFGGLTIAFTSLGEEVAKSKKGVDSLQFGDRSIVVEFNEPYYVIVIADRPTFFLQLEMEEYLSELKRMYPEFPRDGRVIPPEVFDELNKKFFPLFSV